MKRSSHRLNHLLRANLHVGATLTKTILSVFFVLFFFHATAQSSSSSPDEKIIRDLVDRINQNRDSIPYTDDLIFVSGPFPRPMIGRADRQGQAIRDSLTKVRSNQTVVFTINRIQVARSGDIAYEFGDFVLSYEELINSNRRHTGNGSYVRAWKKVNGKWMVDVAFMRPNQKSENQ